MTQHIAPRFNNEPELIDTFFKRNFSLVSGNTTNTFKLYGNQGSVISLKVVIKNGQIENIYSPTNKDIPIYYINMKELINRLDIIDAKGVVLYTSEHIPPPVVGGSKANPVKKEVCGKLRCIYKIPGSRKEHLKYKGQLITVADYKRLYKLRIA